MRVLLLICLLVTSLHASCKQQFEIKLLQPLKQDQLMLLPLAHNHYPKGLNASLSNRTQQLQLTAKAVSYWPDRSIKTVLLSSNQPLTAGSYQLSIQPTQTTIPRISQLPDKAQLLDYRIDSDYLLATGLRTTAREATDKNYLEWFYYGAEQYGKTIIEDPKIWESTSAWLYDYPATLYGLYFATGDPKWKQAAHEAAQFFANLVDKRGFFSRKPNDVKYIATLGLYLDALLYPYSGNPSSHALERLYQASLNWDPDYPKGFWTERHQAATLMAAVIHWEHSQSTHALRRLTEIIDATHEMIFDPITKQISGCAAHRHSAHEGGKRPFAVCSPWMSVLLADALWRYWRLSGDEKSAQMISSLGKFVLQQGTYQVKRKYGPLTVPYYLRTLEVEGKLEKNGWTDVHHNCDVASLLVRSGYLHKLAGDDSKPYRLLADKLLVGCERETIKNRTPDKRPRPWPIRPLRKFNWWYNAPADLPWVYSRLD